MYGKGMGLGVTNVATGVSLLPNTGDSRVLFIVAGSLLVSGVAIMVATVIMSRKNRARSEA